MKIEIQDTLKYIETQKKLFKILPVASEYKEGVQAGLDIVKAFLEAVEKQGGTR